MFLLLHPVLLLSFRLYPITHPGVFMTLYQTILSTACKISSSFFFLLQRSYQSRLLFTHVFQFKVLYMSGIQVSYTGVNPTMDEHPIQERRKMGCFSSTQTLLLRAPLQFNFS